MRNRDEVAIVGYAGRLPGARSAEAFWSVLEGNRSTVSWITPDRFPHAAFYHPSPGQIGKSYTFAAGLIDDVWGFDAAAFGMSPREAEQVDPQQRHLLEVTYDALAHAGIRPSSLAGSDTGVYVGASSLDYGARFFADPGAADVHMMTGNTLSVVANRLSYNLDLRGPSFTIDTACSSSLVALNVAAEAIRNGIVETAVVAGVNLLLSPFSFIGFSRASMLSPTGRCRPFDAEADGYVRAEGAIVLILRSVSCARKSRNRIHASIVGSGVGQDGRTTGLSLPSAESQRRLLEQIYGDFGIDPGDLAFVEAHGTGTKAGDPMEADALGKALARRRSRPLLIGSVKSNIGHLEPASGLAGTLKAILALNRATLPATLHQNAPSPDIPFGDLNLKVVDRNWRLSESPDALLAGVNSFGFGGTNAHVVLRGEDKTVSTLVRGQTRSAPFLLTAHAAEALPELGKAYLEHWPADARSAGEFIGAAAHQRDVLPHRAVVHGRTAEEVRNNLGCFVRGDATADVLTGQALGNDLPVAFLFAGNGSQWAGMGRAAWATNRPFQDALRELDAHFMHRQEWSIVDLLFDEHLAAKLRLARFAQPVLFALQVATVRALDELGVVPTATLGHSVGEIAAAWSAGALALDAAIDIVIARSRHQEATRGTGGMAALLLGERDARNFLDTVHAQDVAIAAVNSWRSVTISGPIAAIDQVIARATERKIGARRLDLDYPFHHPLVNSVRGPLARELENLKSLPPRRRFVSSVTGSFVDREPLGPEHWWRNVREPVQFEAGLNCLLNDGMRIFVEISPRSILASYVRDTFRDARARGVIVETLTEKDGSAVDPLRDCAAHVLLAGGRVDFTRYFGPAPVMAVPQPGYPWRHAPFTVRPTPEAQTTFSPPAHPLLGTRLRGDCSEWFSVVDPQLVPWLGDHRVGGVTVFPAAAYVEVMIAAAREAYGGAAFELRDLDIRRPLVFDGTTSVETLLRLAPETGIAEFLSRPRGGASEWSLVARGIAVRTPTPHRSTEIARSGPIIIPQSRVYQLSQDLGFDYGAAFRRVRHVSFPTRDCAVALLETPESALFADCITDLTGLDAAFHALFASEEAGVSGPLTRMLPTRFDRLQVYAPGVIATQAVARTVRRSPASIVADIELLDPAGNLLLFAQGVRLVEAPSGPSTDARSLLYAPSQRWLDRPGRASPVGDPSLGPAVAAAEREAPGALSPDGLLLVEAACLRMAWAALRLDAAGAPIASPSSAAAEVSEDHAGRSFLRSALLWHLETRGLAVHRAGRVVPTPSCDLPETGTIVRSLLDLDPMMTAEAAMLSRLGEILPELFADGATARDELTSARWHELGLSSRQIQQIGRAVFAQAASILERADSERLLRVLVLGADHIPGARALFERFARCEFLVSDRHPERLEKACAMFGDDNPHVRFVAWSELATLDAATIDLALSIDALSDIAAARDGLAPLIRLLRPAAPFIAGELAPSLFWDIVRGVRAEWWARSASTDFPVGALLTRREWIDELESIGFGAIAAEPVLSHEGIGVVVRAAASARPVPALSGATEPPRLVWEGGDTPIAARLKEAVDRRLAAVASDPSAPGAAERAPTLVLVIDGRAEASAASLLGAQLEDIAGRCQYLAAASQCLRVLVDCGEAFDGEPLDQPTWCAVTAALRVVENEYPTLQVRCLGLARDAQTADLEGAVDELLAATAERAVFFAGGKRLVARIERGDPNAIRTRADDHNPTTRTVVKRGAHRGVLEWMSEGRAEPGAGEIEIEVRATGLNFRDVMWNLGLLPEEALEDGFAGPTLGMECSGRVSAVGADAAGFGVGDRVIAFASGAFASHVVVPAWAAARLSREISFEAAATLPVAFLTAYYSLVHLGRLQRGETILVHGGAGAVGLAALQLAKHCGARVVATAGSEEKRALLRNLGADLVLDSRSLTFAEAVQRWTGSGVDLVLNSLAGEAMIRSIDCLKPFGRFIELGKRDYYGNTHVGLRPFRRNLTYFGVDVDQLIGSDQALLQRLLADVVALLGGEGLSPLPFRVYPPEDIDEAFRLMQRSGHIGKVVVTAPTAGLIKTHGSSGRFQADAEGTHVVIGGVGGFGLATAEWLVERGARHLLLMSRSGTVSEVAAEKIDGLRRRGIEVEVSAVDVADETALAASLRAAEAGRPIRGIVHAAMVLDDRLIESMDRQALDTVLRPKVGGAVNLERLAGALALDYLFLYSSATTLMGNPGQFNYVAANAYMEGLARRARTKGLPALAIAWGGIADVGYLSQHMRLNAGLKRRFAGSLMDAREALNALDWAYDADGRLSTACLAIARVDWTSAWRELNALRAPTFSGIVSPSDARLSWDASATLEVLKAMSLPDATASILDTIVDEIAGVLRLPPREVDRHRPLAEIGMDSLMMLELRLKVETTLQIDLPMMSLATGITAADVARRIALIIVEGEQRDAISGSLAALSGSHIGAEADTAGGIEREAAVRAVVDRSNAFVGPL